MWFGKKVLGLKVPTNPPIPVGEMRAQCVTKMQGKVAIESAFPLAGPDGRYLCKGCGVPFDTYGEKDAIAALREGILELNSGPAMLHIQCSKCMRSSLFSPKEVITRHSSDPFGPWTDDELDAANSCLEKVFRFSPAERSTIMATTVHQVLYLYR